LSGDYPTLSLIVPSYNSSKYLKDLIGSILGGETSLGIFPRPEFVPNEIVICDDCSKDDTEEIIRELKLKYPEIVYVRTKTNSGTAVACNTAIEKATGEYITRIDADDMRESGSLQKLMDAQLENKHSFIYDDAMIFVHGKRTDKTWVMRDYNLRDYLDYNGNHSGIMFPKVAWKECGGYPPEFSNGRDDWAINIALGSIGYCGVHISGAGYLYRREQQNRTVRTAGTNNQELFALKIQNRFKNLYSGSDLMCCGNRRSGSNNVQPSSKAPVVLVGSAGMTLLRYLGMNYGEETYFGPVTGTAYKFKKNAVRNVDNRDLSTPKQTGLLDLQDHGNRVFEVYVP